jgi:hypothetical protein
VPYARLGAGECVVHPCRQFTAPLGRALRRVGSASKLIGGQPTVDLHRIAAFEQRAGVCEAAVERYFQRDHHAGMIARLASRETAA